MWSRVFPSSHARICWTSGRAVSLLVPQLGPHRQKLLLAHTQLSEARSPFQHGACKTLTAQQPLHRCAHRFAAVSGKAEDAEVAEHKSADLHSRSKDVRVRFAPSPTGTLHVGGARTALFNWLYAANQNGKMILRIEDTDQARSTKESELEVMADLAWLGIDWQEGPDVGGDYGPYRQSERQELYQKYAQQLVKEGLAYPDFCTEEELSQADFAYLSSVALKLDPCYVTARLLKMLKEQKMKREAEANKEPPVYRGKWAQASQEEVDEMLAQGAKPAYRFRVPKDKTITVPDAIRGDVSWNTDTLGDFIILRSDGSPVYNFCVAVDDALMKISHVIRAEEHLPNTLRQILIFQALGFTPPVFGHLSLILAPDRSKMSKRHGATSVTEFRAMGYMPQAINNYLSLLGWNEGTEQEVYTLEELKQKFSLDRITKSGAVFDRTKLAWMNGQHLKLLPHDQVDDMITHHLVERNLLSKEGSTFAQAAAELLRESVEVLPDAEPGFKHMLEYPFKETAATDDAKKVLEDDFAEIANAVLQAWDNGEIKSAVDEKGPAGFKSWLNKMGKGLGRKGARCWMPTRLALTGSLHGCELPQLVALLLAEDGDVADRSLMVPLADRMEQLRAYVTQQH